MTNPRVEQLTAAINMWLVNLYYRDLCEYFAGDEGQFSRMVEREGKSLATANPAGWCKHIENLAPRVVHYHFDELKAIYADLAKWGLITDDSILSVEVYK